MLDNVTFLTISQTFSFRARNYFYALNGYERVLASLVSSALGSPLVIAE